MIRPSPRLLRLAFYSAALFAFVMAVRPQALEIEAHGGDKILHFIAFSVLGGLGLLAHRTRPWAVLLGLAIFGAVIEGVQALPMVGRDCSLWDWVTDMFGIALGMGLAHIVVRRRWL